MNLSNSSMAGIGVEDMELVEFTQLFGCKVESWPLKYLGLPLGGTPRSLFLGPCDGAC